MIITSVSHYYEHMNPDWKGVKGIASTHILLFVLRGALEYTVENQTFMLTKGCLLLCPPGVFRKVRIHSKDQVWLYLFRFVVNDPAAVAALPILHGTSPCFVTTSHFEYMKQRFSLITQQWLRKSKYSVFMCMSILLEVLALICEEAESVQQHGKSYGHVLKLQNYMLQHFRRPISLSELAEHIGRTPNYVSVTFKQSTGQSVSSYIQQLKITNACDLLVNSEMNIREISDFLGFCDPSYFNKVFKRLTGQSPSAYLDEHPHFSGKLAQRK